MDLSNKQSKLLRLISRLRDIEAECLRLSASDPASDRVQTRKLYQERLDRLDASHSQSWFGDHSDTYFDGFLSPPAGRSFDVEWGFIPGFHGAQNRGWRIYSQDEIRAFLFHDLDENILYELKSSADRFIEELSNLRDQTLDVLEALSKQINSQALNRYIGRIEKLAPYKIADFVGSRINSTPRISRDSVQIAKGQKVPIHVQFLSPISSITINKARLTELAATLRKVIEAVDLAEIGPTDMFDRTRIFIGHGGSGQWRILKDFLSERLNLEYEEFNRVSTAGINTQERLSEMLNQCGFCVFSPRW